MKNESCSKVIRIGLLDPKLAKPLFFKIDLNNMMPAIRQARICYAKFFMANGPFRRQPLINVIFELPDEDWKYARSWPVDKNHPSKILELSKEVMDQPVQLICEILRAWNECEKVWIKYIEGKILEFEKNSPQAGNIFSQVLQFNQKRQLPKKGG